MSTALPLVIVLFVYSSGVYCPSFLRPGAGIYRPETPENELPSYYPLNGCVSHTRSLVFDSSSVYELNYNEERPSACELIQRTTGRPNVYPFERADIKVTSMMEEEMTFIKVSAQMPWTVTCFFQSVTLAQQFYKLITRDRVSDSVPFVRADYLKNSNDVIIAEQLNLHTEGEEFHLKVVVKNNVGDVVLLFRKNAVIETNQREPTMIEVKIRRTTISGVQRLYKLGFSSPEQAASLIQLLGDLSQLSDDSRDSD